VESDTTWQTLVARAASLSTLSTDTVDVAAVRRGLVRVREGLEVGDKWTYVPAEWVRQRWRVLGSWREIQSIENAASRIEAFLQERPDLRS
jgi:hypothetical protein